MPQPSEPPGAVPPPHRAGVDGPPDPHYDGEPMRIAVVGTGIAGLGVATALHGRQDLTLFEADGHVGGHANTVEVDTPRGPIAVDTGFIVYNERNYPLLTRLFSEHGVPTEPSDMSFSIS